MPYLISFRAQIVGLVLCISGLNLSAAPKIDLIELYHGVAEGNYLIGDLGGAERGVEQMLRIDPDYLPALTLKARVLLDQNKPVQALKAAERAIVLEPENHKHSLLKALVLSHADRREEAAALIQQILAKAVPESDEARVAKELLSLLLIAEGDWDDAALELKKFILPTPKPRVPVFVTVGKPTSKKLVLICNSALTTKPLLQSIKLSQSTKIKPDKKPSSKLPHCACYVPGFLRKSAVSTRRLPIYKISLHNSHKTSKPSSF